MRLFDECAHLFYLHFWLGRTRKRVIVHYFCYTMLELCNPATGEAHLALLLALNMGSSYISPLPSQTRWHIPQCETNADGECIRRILMNISLTNIYTDEYTLLF